MLLSTLLSRGKKALRMSPRQLLRRLREEAQQQTKRPWASVYPRTLADRALLENSGAASLGAWWEVTARDGAFFLKPADRQAWCEAFIARFPEKPALVVRAADAALEHEFDLLGSGRTELGAAMPWHTDFKTGREWPVTYSRDIEYLELDRPSDVKVPWELSRSQHFTALGQAYWLTGDEKYASEFASEIDDWVARNPLAYGVNWACAMDVALRAVSWIWGFFFFADAEACREPRFRRRFLRALFMHGEFVFRNLETSDVNGNHYLCDGVGLLFVGAFFRHTPRGQKWLERGRRIVIDEIASQVTPDGVDFEASTAYHRLVLELFLTLYLLLDLVDQSAPDACWQQVGRMCDFVAAYTKPSGLAPLIGDADDGRVQKLGTQRLNDHRYLLSIAAVRLSRPDMKAAAGRFWDEAFWIAGPKGAAAFDAMPVVPHAPQSAAFPSGGFYVLRTESAHLIVDCGGVGMRGRGGHGHNDSLSFELFLSGTNVISDCGAFVYTASHDWRNRFRGTAFHNTMQVDGEEINRFVAPDALWQLHDDAAPADVAWRFGADGSWWHGSHTGYRRLASPVQPHRAIWMSDHEPLVAFRDWLEGTGTHRVCWRWHLDPDCDVRIEDGDCCIRSGVGDVWLLAAEGPADFQIEPGWVSPAYGVKTKTKIIVLDGGRALPFELAYVFSAARLDRAARVKAINLCVRS